MTDARPSQRVKHAAHKILTAVRMIPFAIALTLLYGWVRLAKFLIHHQLKLMENTNDDR